MKSKNAFNHYGEIVQCDNPVLYYYWRQYGNSLPERDSAYFVDYTAFEACLSKWNRNAGQTYRYWQGDNEVPEKRSVTFSKEPRQTDYVLDKLQVKTERLAKLLSDRQTGLFVWNTMLANAINDLQSYLNTGETD